MADCSCQTFRCSKGVTKCPCTHVCSGDFSSWVADVRVWVIRAILTDVRLLPVFPQLQTCRCTALTGAMGQMADMHVQTLKPSTGEQPE
jgi:hypothetical protein